MFAYNDEMFTGGKVPMHLHISFTKTIDVVDGSLSFTANGKDFTLNPGESYAVQAMNPHKFWNNNKETAVFNITCNPAREFEKAVIIGDRLATDGFASKKGIPKNLYHLALVIEWADSYTTALPLFI